MAGARTRMMNYSKVLQFLNLSSIAMSRIDFQLSLLRSNSNRKRILKSLTILKGCNQTKSVNTKTNSKVPSTKWVLLQLRNLRDHKMERCSIHLFVIAVSQLVRQVLASSLKHLRAKKMLLIVEVVLKCGSKR
jgi:hypothetical protein